MKIKQSTPGGTSGWKALLLMYKMFVDRTSAPVSLGLYSICVASHTVGGVALFVLESLVRRNIRVFSRN